VTTHEASAHEAFAGHSPEHETLLVAALADEGYAGAGAWSARLAECEQCRQLFEKLSAVRDLLEDAGREERETLAGLDWNQSVPGSEAVAPLVRALAHKRKQQLRSVRARRAVLWTASAAAGVLVAGWIARLLVPPAHTASTDTLLGAQTKSSCTPHGAVVEYTKFEWETAPPAGGWCELIIRDDGPNAPDEPLIREPKLETSSWTPTPQETRKLTDKIRWEVHVYDGSGAPWPGAVYESAERLPRH
jgi:hypothetical protein